MADPRIPALRSASPSGQGILNSTTFREFGGGWNVIDNDLSLNPEYSVILDNWWRRPDGTLSIRHGTTLFADVSGEVSGGASEIINMIQFQEELVCVCDTGEAVSVDADGNVTLRWNDDIANALASIGDWAQSTGYVQDDVVRDSDDGTYWKCLVDHTSAASGTFADDRTANPTYWEAASEGWSTTDFVSFAQFKGQLIVCNGIDKPLIMDFDAANPCQYLADLASGSNANTPIARYVLAGDEFLLMAGDPTAPTTVYISNQGSSGTWAGDGAPNNAVNVDLSTIVTGNNDTINGLTWFRDTVVVGFDTAMVLGFLGIFDGTDHTPDFSDVIEAHGCLSHRSMINLGDDTLFLDNVGVPSLTRTLLTETIRPDRPSELIDPAIQKNINQLTVGTLTVNTFAVYDLLNKQYMLFVPNHDGKTFNLVDDPIGIGATDATNTEYTLVVYLADHGLLEGDSFVMAGATGFNSIAAGTLNTTHEVNTVIDEDYFTIVVNDTELDPVSDLYGGGNSITIESVQTETIGYIFHASVKENRRKRRVWSRFRSWNWSCGCRTVLSNIFFARKDTLKIYQYGNDQNKMTQDYIGDSPQDIVFVWELPWAAFNARFNTKRWRYMGFDSKGKARFTVKTFVDNIYKDRLGNLLPNNEAEFAGGDTAGYGTGSSGYGGARNTRTERNFAWPVKAKLVKVRVEGTTDEQLRIIALIVGYLRGSISA